jgi:hypothetical protein
VPAAPFPHAGGHRVHRTPFWKSQTDPRTVSHAVTLIQPLAGRDCLEVHINLVGEIGGQIFKTCKLSMIFLALIPLVNYYS